MRSREDQTAGTGDTVSEGGRPRRALLGGGAVIVLLVLLKLSIHLLTADNYGYFRDELYYMDAGKHLAPGYVDFPPFVALVAALTLRLLGNSLLALHLFPALAGAAVVALSGLIARELEGGRFAQGLAALSVVVAPDFLVFGTWLSMDAFDQLWWVLASYLLLLILRRGRPRLWLLFGLVAGIGLLTKLTILFFGLAVFVALLLTSARRHLLSVWPWMGGAVALVFLLPYVWWNASHGWPTLEFWANYGEKVPESSPTGFLLQQVLTMNPSAMPIWLAGLYYYLFSTVGKPSRPLGWIYVVLLVLPTKWRSARWLG
jgi:4-amino-4-deoxy-L-arabinose transferase-like glycosyltransferase